MNFTVYKNCYNAERNSLILANYDLRAVTADIIESYGACTVHLDLSHNRLSDLTWIREFPNCSELILDNNRLCETSLNRLMEKFENLKVLMLNKNEFADLHVTVEHLSRLFPNLEHLSLHGNAICPDGLGLRPFSDYIQYSYENYRSFVINAFPSLKFLDHASTAHVDLDVVLKKTNSAQVKPLFRGKFNRLFGLPFCMGQSGFRPENDDLNQKENTNLNYDESLYQ